MIGNFMTSHPQLISSQGIKFRKGGTNALTISPKSINAGTNITNYFNSIIRFASVYSPAWIR